MQDQKEGRNVADLDVWTNPDLAFGGCVEAERREGHGSQEGIGNLLSTVWRSPKHHQKGQSGSHFVVRRWIVPDGLSYSYYLVAFTHTPP
jgi:hypothetical protein